MRIPVVAVRPMAVALIVALLAGCGEGADTAPPAAAVGEARALAEAGEMLDESRAPVAGAEPSPEESGAAAAR